ncbi:MAG: hypothetical protein H6860_06205 [Rhodospirillales bacterium]|nr:hypothetical protein [Alphaproteobacteria bacterium]MCB9981973.1 hypothetical protein [Rhodospirillales bacterium]
MHKILFGLFLIALSTMPAVSFAGELLPGGTPEKTGVSPDATISPDAADMRDIHQRRLDYREEDIKLKEQMLTRAENFAAPRRESLKHYEEKITALNETRTSVEPDEEESLEMDETDEIDNAGDMDDTDEIDDTNNMNEIDENLIPDPQ